MYRFPNFAVLSLDILAVRRVRGYK